MPNRLQLQTIRGFVNKYQTDLGLEPSRAFLHFVLDKYFLHKGNSLNESEIEESIIDGPGDGGIDAIYIEENPGKNPVVYIFQSKYYITDDAYSKPFAGNAVDKMKLAIKEFVLTDRGYERYGNEYLQDKIRMLKNILNEHPKFIVVFCTSGDKPVKDVRDKFNDFLEEINSEAADSYFNVEYLSLENIAGLLVEEGELYITKNLNFSGKYISHDSGNVRLFSGLLPADSLVDLFTRYGERLFDKNVRGFLKKSNPINKEMIETASSDNSAYFVYMNNGVTITCDKMSYMDRESTSVELKGLQVINGQQTIRSLAETMKAGRMAKNVKVSVRIVESSDKKILDLIIKSTNSQNKVTLRDLHSNDQIQTLIERRMGNLGYFYEARKNKYQGLKSRKYRVDAERAAQDYYSAKFEMPALAKDKKVLLYGSLYEDIFNESIDVEEYLASFLLHDNIIKWNKDEKIRKKYSFIRDSALHSVALLFNKFDIKFSDFSDGELKSSHRKNYIKVLDATKKVVDELFEMEGDKYEHRKTFKDPETYGRIIENLK